MSEARDGGRPASISREALSGLLAGGASAVLLVATVPAAGLPPAIAALAPGLLIGSAGAGALAAAVTTNRPALAQLLRFLVVGVLNTCVDLAVFHATLGLLTDRPSPPIDVLAGAKAIGFGVAVLNSYLWNRSWTFAETTGGSRRSLRELLLFVAVSLVGLAVNVATATAVVSAIPSRVGAVDLPWATIGALAGTVVAFAWSFIGSRLIVFSPESSRRPRSERLRVTDGSAFVSGSTVFYP